MGRGALDERVASDADDGTVVAVDARVHTPRRLGYERSLDGMRAIAIALVVLFHSPLSPSVRGGWMGVDVFFVLSGFLITVLLLQEREKRGRVSLRGFYARRALRLWPALFVYLATFAILANQQPHGAREWWLHETWLSLTYRYNFYVGHGFAAPGTGHMWSLAMEEQFYVVWPLLLVVALGVGRRVRPARLFAVSLAALAGMVAWRAHLLAGGAEWTRLYFPPDVRADGLLVGCLAGQLYVFRDLTGRWVRRSLGLFAVLAAAGLAYGATHVGPNTSWLYGGPLTALNASVALAVLWLLGSRGWAKRVLSTPPFVVLGRLSYSIYLWHALAIFYVNKHLEALGKGRAAALAIAISLVVGALSHVLVEKPFLLLKDRLSKRSAPPPTPTVAVPADPVPVTVSVAGA